MTEQQEKHLNELKTIIGILLNNKYRKGQEVHQGNLFDLSVGELLDEAINEAIDQITYLLTAKSKLNDFKDHMEIPGQPRRDLPAIPTPKVRSVGFFTPNEKLY